MKIITETMVETHLTMKDCIAAMRGAMSSVSRGDTTLPIRQYMPIPDTQGKMALMPGTITSPDVYGIKLVCKYVREPGSPYGTHVGMVLVFDSETGLPLAMVEGSSLTAIRTAAVSALATHILANPDCETLAILGCGEQARRHIHAMLAVRSPKKIFVWGRNLTRAETFAKRLSTETGQTILAIESAKEAVESADLICTTTSSKTPVLQGDWVKSGTHLNLVGAAIASSREVDDALVLKSRYFTDYRPAAMAAAGELLDAIKNDVVTEGHVVGEIGEVIESSIKGRISSQDITVYKSLGVAAQDLAAAHWLYEKSLKLDFGTEINLLDHTV